MKNEELAMILGELRGDIKSILKNQENMHIWQQNHTNADQTEFKELHKRINGMNRYGSSIAAVAAFIGVGLGISYQYILTIIKKF